MKKLPSLTGSVVCLIAASWTTPPQVRAQAADEPVASAYVQRMMTLDRDRNGFLSASELPATLASLMTSHDQNGDRQLSPAELAAQEQAMRNQRDQQSSGDAAAPGRRRGAGRRGAGRREAGNQRGPGRGRPGEGGSPLDAAQILRFALTFDADGDGGLNAAELKRYATALAVRRGQARAKHGSVPALPEKPPNQEAPDRNAASPAKDGQPSIPAAKGLGADGRGDGGFGDDAPKK